MSPLPPSTLSAPQVPVRSEGPDNRTRAPVSRIHSRLQGLQVTWDLATQIVRLQQRLDSCRRLDD